MSRTEGARPESNSHPPNPPLSVSERGGTTGEHPGRDIYESPQISAPLVRLRTRCGDVRRPLFYTVKGNTTGHHASTIRKP